MNKTICWKMKYQEMLENQLFTRGKEIAKTVAAISKNPAKFTQEQIDDAIAEAEIIAAEIEKRNAASRGLKQDWKLVGICPECGADLSDEAELSCDMCGWVQ